MTKRNQNDGADKPVSDGPGSEASQSPTPTPEQDASAPVGGRTTRQSKTSPRAGKAGHTARPRTARDEVRSDESATKAIATESTEGTETAAAPVMRIGRARAAQDAVRAAAAMQSGERYLSRKHRWSQVSQMKGFPQHDLPVSSGSGDNGSSASGNEGEGQQAGEVADAMDMSLFPLKNVVLFPGMMLPLHIFEPRYREMINRCIEEESQFGVVLIEEGDEVGGGAMPHRIGTAARISKVTRQEDGRINIVAVGTQRFEILSLDESKPYLQARVKPLPIVNGGTRLAGDLAQRLMPRIFEYVDMLEKATKQKLPINRLPEDPTTLAILVGIGMQAPPKDKQKLLEKSGVPEMLAYEGHLLSREALFLRHMVETQHEVQQLNTGPTGYIFPN